MEKQDKPIVLIVALLICGWLGCFIIGLVYYLAVLLSRNPAPLFQGIRQQTPTAISLEEVNSVSTLGTFYFGLDDVNSLCQVKQQVDRVSQEDILRYQFLYFSVPFDSKYEGQRIDWSVYNLRGEYIDSGPRQSLTLDGDLKQCLKVDLYLNPRTDPGTYILEVRFTGKLAYRKVFTISYSDLNKIPRPNRKPFGDIQVGRLVDLDTCTVGHLSNTFSLVDIDDDPWFYIASPFQIEDIGKKIYWSVYTSSGYALFKRYERTLYDDINLCFWQGFSVQGISAGKYSVVIEDDQLNVLYQWHFEIK
jgi:hypothetical protein